MFSLRDKPEKFTEDSESLRPTSPDDLSSVVSCSTSDAVIIEGNIYTRISGLNLMYKGVQMTILKTNKTFGISQNVMLLALYGSVLMRGFQ